MGSGSYVLCEWKSVQKEFPNFQQAFMNLESQALNLCNNDWAPKKFNLASTFGMGEGEYGRTSIIPGAFDDHSSVAMATYRQAYTSVWLAANNPQGTIMQGVGSGETIPENVKIALMGFAFPNKEQHISEIKMQIADTKFGRYDLEEMLIMDTPALIFEEGYILNEEESFHLYAHFDTTGITQIGNWTTIYQRVVPIGALYYQQYGKVGGNTGTAIVAT